MWMFACVQPVKFHPIHVFLQLTECLMSHEFIQVAFLFLPQIYKTWLTSLPGFFRGQKPRPTWLVLWLPIVDTGSQMCVRPPQHWYRILMSLLSTALNSSVMLINFCCSQQTWAWVSSQHNLTLCLLSVFNVSFSAVYWSNLTDPLNFVIECDIVASLLKPYLHTYTNARARTHSLKCDTQVFK